MKESGTGPGDGNGFLYYYDPCRSFRLAGAGLACDGVSVSDGEGEERAAGMGGGEGSG